MKRWLAILFAGMLAVSPLSVYAATPDEADGTTQQTAETVEDESGPEESNVKTENQAPKKDDEENQETDEEEQSNNNTPVVSDTEQTFDNTNDYNKENRGFNS